MHPAKQHHDACRLGILCPDAFPDDLQEIAGAAIRALLDCLIDQGLPPPLIIAHLLASGTAVACAQRIDSGTVIRFVQGMLDESIEVLEQQEGTPPG